jgi:hypothetical protein
MNGTGNQNEAEFLIVPTNLQAYVVGKRRSDKPYNLTPAPRSEAELSDWYTEAKYIFRPMDKGQTLPKPLDPGVHLHWALPAALTHSIHRASDKSESTQNPAPEQPYVPNRWLVLRMWYSGDVVYSKGWVVEGDYASLEPGSTPFTFFGTPPPDELKSKKFGYVGRAPDVETWSESHLEYRFRLTSFGWGDPSFAAYYPACQGIFGFHDTLKDLTSPCSLNYLVVGWYSDPAQDPLPAAGAWKDVDVKECIKCPGTLPWSCSLKGISANAFPVRTLCSGSVVGISWQPDLEYNSLSLGTAPKMAIGGSSSEAMAALLAKDAEPQQALCAFQEGQARQISDLDELGELLHRQSFSAVPGGKLWALEPKDQNTAPQSVLTAIPNDIRTKLNDLNKRQGALDELARKQESQRWRVFANWVQDPTRSSISLTVDADADQKKKVGDAKETVRNALQTAKIPMKLGDATMPPFLQPKDPFLIIDSKDLDGMDRTRSETGDGGATDDSAEPLLPCRLATQLISGLCLNRLDYSDTWQAGEHKYLPLRFPQFTAAVPGALAKRLALETLLFDPTSPAPKLPDGIPPIDSDLFLSLKQGSGLSRSDQREGELKWVGQGQKVAIQRPNQLALTLWGGASKKKTNPFLPVFLMWRAHWSPYYKTASDHPGHTSALTGWHIASSDLMLSDGLPYCDIAQYVELEGTTIVSYLSGKRLADKLEEFAKAAAPKLIPSLTRIPHQVLGQSLGGLNEILIRRILGLFLPPLKDSTVDSGVWTAIDKIAQPFMPDIESNTFLPVRSGALKLIDVWIVDAFGQVVKLIDHAAAADRPQLEVKHTNLPDELPRGYHARFAPRLVQPARLNFEWKVEYAQSVMIRVISHQQHAKVAADSITIHYELTNPTAYAEATPTFGLQLDRNAPLTTTTTRHSFIGLTPGEHTVSIQLINAKGTPVQNSQTDFQFTVVTPSRANEPDSGPLCGWIVPNYLEQNFAVFSAVGEPLGLLHDASSRNQQLNRFLNLVKSFLSKESGEEWTAFCNLVESVLRKPEGRIPPKDPTSAVLLGRPLALVRASLSLELHGLPIGYWTQDLQFVTEDFENLRVPVRLGGLNLSADGLVGYIPEQGPPCLFATTGASPTVTSSRIKFTQELTVAAGDKEPVALTLLMDPGARVHAACGILPRSAFVLPPEIAGLSSLIQEVSLSVAPVLCERPRTAPWRPTMPRPSDAFGQWSWATRPAINGSSWPEIQQADDRARFVDDLALLEGELKLRLKQDQHKATQ